MVAHPVDMGEYAAVVGATLAFFAMWYGFLTQQMMMRGVAAERAREKGIELTRFDYRFAEWEMADRTFLNMQEQSAPFLLLMWLYAVFCNARVAGVLGFVYVGFRFVYPILWSTRGRFTILVELSTQPNYLVIGWYFNSLCYTAISGDVFEPTVAFMWPVYLVVSWFIFMLATWGLTGGLLVTINKYLYSMHDDI
eukprot:TRINITY_DN33060_c0_g1_i1.p1 TRINITY_DN33060_c0_g1~~TRINITY_DN33060_c0_g1_i1.p1  ORF type:complete len:195 (-),score=41.91 TRINITY_DN33060_c0_g1_i1:367-951(-)